MKTKPLNEQVVVVCGASSGIGRETAKRFARAGAKVVVAARGDEGLESLADEIRAEGGEAFVAPADVTNPASMHDLAAAAVERYGRIDTWAHIAGVSVYGYFTDVPTEEFARVIETDLIGVAHGAKAAIPHLQRDGGGTFVAVGSVLGKRSVPLMSAYCAAKHGVDGFLESLRMELRHQRIPVNVVQILPSTINTPFFATSRTRMGEKPMGPPPFYPASDVATAIVYVAKHPVRDMTVGGAGKMIVAIQRLSPGMFDRLMMPAIIRGIKSGEPKDADAPNNLDTPVANDRVEGEFGNLTHPGGSLMTWLDTHPRARLAAMAGAIAGVAVLARRNGKATEKGMVSDVPPTRATEEDMIEQGIAQARRLPSH